MFATGGSVNIAPVSSVERQVEPHLQGLSMQWASYAGDCRHVGPVMLWLAVAVYSWA